MSEVQYGRYRIVAPIARGGMAEVFAGRLVGEAGFSRPVAIKSIRADLIADPNYVTMFLDEARLAATIQSSNVVHTFDLGRTDEGVPFMVMELVIGATITQLINATRPHRIPLEVSLPILVQSLNGLEDAHAALSPSGDPMLIVHRDIAPKNILVGLDGRARVMDFGIAHAVERLTRTSTGQVKGTVRYFSPEQADLRAVDQRSDIFSMGIVAFETLTGRRLFDGKGMMEIYSQITKETIPDVREYAPEVPKGIARVVARALERDVDARWQRAGDFAHALAREGNTSSASTREIGTFVRRHLPAHMKELSALLREDSSSFQTEALTTLEDDAPPTSLTNSPPIMTPVPPPFDIDVELSESGERSGARQGWWSRLMHRLFG